MKTRIKLMMIGAVGTWAVTGALAQPAANNDGPGGGPPGDGARQERPMPEGHRKMLLEKYDADKDGKLNDKESAALGRDLFEGKLPPPNRGPGRPGGRGGPSFEDREGGFEGGGFGPPPRRPRGGDERGMGPRERGMHGPPHGRRHGGEFGPPDMERRHEWPGPRGFGQGDPEQAKKMMDERRAEFVKNYDANKNGKLDSAEREAIGKDIEEGKLPPPPPMRRSNRPEPKEDAS